jgi:hypothetical protein
MDDSLFEEILSKELLKVRGNRSKPVKRKWREIEEIRDRQRLKQELMEMDVCLELDDIDF